MQTRYDGNNNVRRVTEHYYGTAINDRITTHDYDNFDRLLKQVDSFGQVTKFGYDLNGVRTSLTDADNKTTKYVPDDLNRIAQVVNAQGTTQYDYFRDSRLKTVTYPNSISSRYTYDRAGRVDTIVNTQNNAVVSSYDYDYDRNGNRTEQIEINGGDEETTTYDFDNLDRLTHVSYPNDAVTYTYDLAYNRKTERQVDTGNVVIKDWRYQYNDRHQLTDILDQLDDANNITYSYDNNGNQTAKVSAGDVTAFLFDARDDLRKVQVGGSTVGQFLYDANGLRIEKAGDRGIERYTYDDLSVLRQFDENNQTLAKFDYGPNRLLSLRHATEGTQFYLMDALNSVVNTANATGWVQTRYKYDAWGNQRNIGSDSWNRFGFTGHEHDTETGLIYAKARFYDPETGRFLGQDAWEGDTQLPPSLHKYLYAYQNPTAWTDPDGNQPVYEQGNSFSDKPHEGQLGTATLGPIQERIHRDTAEVANAGSPDCANGCVKGNGTDPSDSNTSLVEENPASASQANEGEETPLHVQRVQNTIKNMDRGTQSAAEFFLPASKEELALAAASGGAGYLVFRAGKAYRLYKNGKATRAPKADKNYDHRDGGQADWEASKTDMVEQRSSQTGGGQTDWEASQTAPGHSVKEVRKIASSAIDELKQLPSLAGKTQNEVADMLKARGYTSVPANSGGTVWTKALPDGNTAAVRLDPAIVRIVPKGNADEVPHAHKEIVPTAKVINGNYKPGKHVTTLDDNCCITSDPRKNIFQLNRLSMVDYEIFKRIAVVPGFRYPPSFLELGMKFVVLSETKKFKMFFPGFSFCLDEDIRAAYENDVPEDLIPFMLERQSSVTDYYCFDSSDNKVEKKVVVFSVHETVNEWNNFRDFYLWVVENSKDE